MPIYDYVCSNCRHRTEVIHGINDAGPKFCPNCGAEGTLRKAMTTPAVHFKGSGWAKKDRSSTSGSRSRSGSGSGDSGTGSTGSTDGGSSGGASPSTSGAKGGSTSEAGKGATSPTSSAED